MFTLKRTRRILMTDKKPLAHLIVKSFDGHKVIKKIALHNLDENHVERVMLGLLRQMDRDRFYVDDSEVDEARKK